MQQNTPNFQEAMALLEDPQTLTLDAPQAAMLIGISRPHAYQVIAETGSLGGIPIIKIGNRIKVPIGPLRDLLGISVASAKHRNDQ